MRTMVNFMLGSHMDLFWMGATRDCLDAGCDIICRAMELCEKYPSYCFYIESVVFTEYFLRKHPDKRNVLLKLIHENRFEIGCSYADRYEHLYGGESIVRHHVLAWRWLEHELGIKPESTCHSDLPGLSPQLPQICAQVGIDYYIRARGPCGVYNWEAPDGTRIVYCSVGYSYGKANDKRRQMELAKINEQAESGFVLPFYIMRGGYGDLQMPDDDIVSDCAKFAEFFPNLDFTISSPSGVLRHYKQEGELFKKLPRLSGEWPMGWGNVCAGFIDAFQKDLYLENHLLTAEKITAISGFYGGNLTSLKTKEAMWWIAQGRIKGEIKPPPIAEGSELDEMWKAELYGQDHNYAGFGGPKSDLDRAIIKYYCEKYADEIIECGMSNIDTLFSAPESLREHNPFARLMVFNQMAWNRDSRVEIKLSETQALPENFILLDASGNEMLYQKKEDRLGFVARNLPSLGFSPYYLAAAVNTSFDVMESGIPWYSAVRKNNAWVVDTSRYRLSVDLLSGAISSLYDKFLCKELTGDSSNSLFGEIIAYEESGVDVVYNFTGRRVRDSEHITSVSLKRSPLSVTIEVETSLFESKIVKEFTLFRDLPTIDIKATLYWWGKMNQQLRFALPFTKEDFEKICYGVPFYSMTWPKMMEGIADDVVLGVGDINSDEIDAYSRLHIRDVCKWLDVGYKEYGVAIGFKTTCVFIDGCNIEPLILRTGISCGDPHVNVTNAGRHEIEFTLYPHSGGWREAGVYRFGWENANPPLCRFSENTDGSGILTEAKSLFTIDRPNVILSAMKPAFDRPEALTLRFFETHGEMCDMTLSCPGIVTGAKEVNLIEEEKGSLRVIGEKVLIPIKPYQIKTVLLTLKREVETQ